MNVHSSFSVASTHPQIQGVNTARILHTGSSLKLKDYCGFGFSLNFTETDK